MRYNLNLYSILRTSWFEFTEHISTLWNLPRFLCTLHTRLADRTEDSQLKTNWNNFEQTDRQTDRLNASICSRWRSDEKFFNSNLNSCANAYKIIKFVRKWNSTKREANASKVRLRWQNNRFWIMTAKSFSLNKPIENVAMDCNQTQNHYSMYER